MGYHRAGFEIVGVDIKPQPHYPFEFRQADALDYLADWIIKTDGRPPFDAIHASPPCQAYSSATRDHGKHPDLYEQTRDLLIPTRLPWVIENVIGAPYSGGVVLCGSMFALEAEDEWIQRHRNFEASWFMFQPKCDHPAKRPVTVTGNSFVTATREYDHSRQTTFANAQALMGINWMTRDELGEAIPPAYTEWIGLQLIAALERAA